MSKSNYNSPVFAAWRASCQDVWDEYTQHRFVLGIGDGSLPREAFIHYLIQDYVFLVHFSRAWAMAVVKAGSLEEMRTAAGTVDALVNHEMQLHVETCAAEGIDEQTLFDAAEEPENMAYTRFVLSTGMTGDFLDMMAALAPCVFGYGEIGINLGKSASASTPYRNWIDTYSGEDYQSVCVNVAATLEGAAKSRIGEDFQSSPRWLDLCQTFSKATKLEVGFWEMAMRGGR